METQHKDSALIADSAWLSESAAPPFPTPHRRRLSVTAGLSSSSALTRAAAAAIAVGILFPARCARTAPSTTSSSNKSGSSNSER
ncbi:unnamed protein product [Lampetra planeri]